MCRRVPSPASRVARKIPRLLGLVLLAGLGTAAFADCPAVCPTTCYYVDNVAGNDSNAGTSPSAAWAHLFHVRAQVYSASAILCLKRGDVWYGRLGFYSAARGVTSSGAALTADGTASNPFTIDAYGSGGAPVLNAEYPTSASQWSGTCSAHICSWVTGGGTGLPEGQPTRIDMVKFGSVWGTCQGGSVPLYCPSTGGAAALTADYQFNYNTSTGVLAVYDDIGSNPVTDYGGIAAVTDGESQLLDLDGVNYVSVAHLELLNQSWYGLQYRGNAGTDHLVVANVYSDTEVPFNFHGTGFFIQPGANSTDLNFYNDEAHRGFYGFDFECQSQPCSGGGAVYGARSDTAIVQPPTPTPNLGNRIGANTCFTPATFNLPVCRMTDAGFDPSKPNFTLETNTAGSGDVNLWNTDSTLLTVQNEGSRLYPISFNPATYQTARLYPTNPSWSAQGGFWIAGGGTSWSYATNTLLYVLSGTKLTSYNFSGYNTGGSPPAAATVYDFTSGSNCLAGGYSDTWDSFGEGSKNPADSVFLAAYSDSGAQGTGYEVVAYKAGSGCSHLNTLTGVVTGDWGTTGTAAIADRFYVHNVKISKDGQWALVAQAACAVNPSITSISLNSNVVTAVLSSAAGLSIGSTIDVEGVTPGSFNVNDVTLTSVDSGTNTIQYAQSGANATGSGGKIDNCISQLPYLWQIGTPNLYASCTQGNKCGGHWTEGFSHFVNNNNSPGFQQDIRIYGSNSPATALLSGLPPAGCTDVQTDQHQNWSNVDPLDTLPFFSSTAAVAGNAQVPGSYNCAWVNEVIAIQAASGTTFRFAHTETTGLSWNFSSQYAIGAVSQDGRFYAWTSDWQGTLGSEGGANGACTHAPNSSTACRSDVFVVALGAPVSPANGISNATLTNVKAYFNRSFGLNDVTLTGKAAHYSYAHFYGNQIKWPIVGDVNGGVAGANVISGMTDPAVRGWNVYVPRVALNFGDVGRQNGADTAFNNYATGLGSAPVSIGVATNYPIIPSLVTEIQGWVNAGYDISLLGLSDTSYQNPNVLIIQYTGTGTAASMTISGSPLTLAIAVTGAADSISYNLTNSAYLTIQQVEFALRATGKFSAVLPQPCSACSWITGSALLSADLKVTSAGVDVRSAPYTMQVDPATFLNSELSGAKSWLSGNLTGVSGKYVYWYPGELFCNSAPCPPLASGTPEAYTVANGYDLARGSISMQAGSDGVQGGYDVVAAAGVDAHGLVTCQMSGWNNLSPVQLAQTIQVLAEKSAVWGVPYLCYFQPGTLSNVQLARAVADFAASGVTLMTDSALASLLEGKTNVPPGSTSYAWAGDGAAPVYDGTETYLSPTLGTGLTLASTYAFDVGGRQQAQFRPGWDMGATVLVPVFLGLRPGK